MAASKLAQFPIQCKLCEEEPNIKFKCLECDLLMCKKCKDKIHPKFKNAMDHRVIDIKELGQQSGEITKIKAELSIQAEYQTNLSEVAFMAVSLDDFLWMGTMKEKKLLQLPSSRALQKVRLEGNKIKMVSSFNEQVLNICITPSNDLLVATYDSTLKIIKKHSNKLSNSVYDVDELIPFCIHVTREHQVIVGAYKKEHERGMVIVMDKDGNYLNRYEKDTNEVDIFPDSAPYNIASTNRGDIFVVQVNKDDTPHKVLKLNSGKIIHIYSGDQSINSEDKPFKAIDVKVTPSDNVIVSDVKNHTLHILNNTGNLLTFINIKTLGISLPVSLAITTVGHFNFLYIGCDTDDSKEKAKLYKLKFSGF